MTINTEITNNKHSLIKLVPGNKYKIKPWDWTTKKDDNDADIEGFNLFHSGFTRSKKPNVLCEFNNHEKDIEVKPDDIITFIKQEHVGLGYYVQWFSYKDHKEICKPFDTEKEWRLLEEVKSK